MKSFYVLTTTLIFILCATNIAVSQNKSIKISGKVIDEYDMGIPYAAVSITSKYIGTATTDEGGFQLLLFEDNLTDSLSISSIGYKSFKILVKDLIKLEDKVFVLEEDVAELSEVKILSAEVYVKNALKNLKNTTISKQHKLNLLYRRFSVEDGKARFFVEHYLRVLDRGPVSSTFDEMEILEIRKSADYRFLKKKQKFYAPQIMTWCNALRRKDIYKNKYEWKKKGDTTYDGEDVIIVEGIKTDGDYLRLYIGMDTYSIYKIENSILNSVFIYKKNNEGELYLSYHNREMIRKDKVSIEMQKLLGLTKPKVSMAYRHEMFVLGLETNKNKIDVKANIIMDDPIKDIGNIVKPYNPTFWDNFAIPPATKFHTKSIKEIESIYGVPIDIQFKMVN